MSEKKNILILGFGFFTLLFGAGNLLFPPIIGITGGKFWWVSIIGFIISDAFFAFLAVLVFSRYSSLSGFFQSLGKRFMSIYCTIIIMIFALLVLPRTASMTYEMSVQPFVSADFNSWIFYIIYFLVALSFTLKPWKIFDILGTIFAPILTLTILGVIFFGIFKLPTHYLPVDNVSSIFRFGFVNGYQTADVLGALFQASLAAAILQHRGYTDYKKKGFVLLRAGVISMIMFIVLYFGLAYVGAKIGGDVGANASPTQVLRYIASSSIGEYGTHFLALTVLVTCFTTGMGILGIIAHFMSDHLFPKIRYQVWAVVFALLSTLIAHKGVDFIIKVAGPILLLVYPLMICFVFLEIYGVKNRFVLRWTCFVTLGFSAIDALSSLKIGFAMAINHFLPLGDLGFVWVIPAVITFIITRFFCAKGIKNKQLVDEEKKS